MRTLVERIDRHFEALGLFIVRHKVVILLAMLGFVIALAYHLPKLVIDTSTEGFLHKTDPARINYDRFRETFGRDEKIVIAIQTQDIFTLKNLNTLKKLHDALKSKVPYLNDITSLINARNTQGTQDALIVDDLLKELPTTQDGLKKIKQTVLSNPLYTDLIINQSGTFTVIVLESNTYTSVGKENVDEFAVLTEETAPKAFISDAENSALVHAAQEIVDRYQSEDFKIYLAGSPAVTAFLKSSMMKDMSKFNLLILVTILIFLALMFRRVSGVILPIVTVILAVLAVMGLMAVTHTSISSMTQILPSFLLAVGIGASVHVLAIFYKSYDTHGDKTRAIARTLGHSGFAITMTSLTTAAGIASFSFSQVATVADLGQFGALGIIFVWLLTLLLLPAFLALLPVKQKQLDPDREHHDIMDRWLKQIALFSYQHAKAIVVGSFIFMAVTIVLSVQIHYEHNPLKWFKADQPIRIATQTIDRELKGSISLEILIDTQKENGLYDYETLKKIEALANYAITLHSDSYFVGKAMSLVDIIKEIHKALNENRPDFYTLPKNARLIAQEILLFENSGSDDLEDFVSSDFSTARLTLKMPWVDAYVYHDILNKLNAYKESHFDSSIKLTFTGLIPLLTTTISAAIDSSGISYLLAFGVIALMMMFVLGSVRLGLLSMIPNLLPIFVVLAIMVLFDFPLDMFTMLIGSIVIGLAVDDTVHFMHNFVRYYHKHPNSQAAITHALTGTGRAMLITSVVLSIGFFIYVFASMNNLFAFGLLTGIAIIAALLADFFLAPALLALYFNKKDTQ